jgi:hypothetical protein
LRIQAGAWLVKEKHLGAAHQGGSEGEALLLPTGKPAHAGPAEGIDSQPLDQLVQRPRVPVHARYMPEQRDGTGRRRQPAVLQHHTDPGAKPGVCGVRVLPQESDGSASAFLKALCAFNRGGLTCTVGAQEGSDLAALGHEGQAAHYPEHLAIQGRERTNVLD